jgi:hypothetical protein
MIQHPYDDIHTFSLGALEPRSADALLDHADRCPTCAVLVAEAMQGVAALATDAPPRANAATLRAVASSSNPSARLARGGSRRWPIAAGLATAACLGLFAWNVQLQSAVSPLAPIPVAALVHSHFVHHPLVGAPGAGNAKAIIAADGSWVFIVADQLAAENQFDVWEKREGKRIRLGSFTADGAGEGTAYFKLPVAKPEGFEVVASGHDPESDMSSLRWP